MGHEQVETLQIYVSLAQVDFAVSAGAGVAGR